MYGKDNWDSAKEKLKIFLSEVKLITSIPTLIQHIINTAKMPYITNERHHKCTPESLAQKWTI